jgi:hypothetical protein
MYVGRISVAREGYMFPLLGIIAAGVSALTAGEAVGLGLTAVGIGASIKGMMDQNEAEEIETEARESYHAMFKKLHRKASSVKDRLEAFSELKREVYQNEIKKAVEVLSCYKEVNLSAYQETAIKSIQCIAEDIAAIECFAYEPESVLSFLAKGAFLTFPIAGFSLAVKGSEALTEAELLSANIRIETARMEKTMITLDAITGRIREGKQLIQALIGQTDPIISALDSYRSRGEKQPSISVMKQVEGAIILIKALKAVIEVDILTSKGLLNGNAGVVFSKVKREVFNAA